MQEFYLCRKPEKALNDCVFEKLVRLADPRALCSPEAESAQDDPRLASRPAAGAREDVANLWRDPEVEVDLAWTVWSAMTCCIITERRRNSTARHTPYEKPIGQRD